MTSDLERSNASLKNKQDIVEQQQKTYDKCEADVVVLEDRLSEKIAHRESIQAEDLDKQISQTENAITTCKAKVKTEGFLDLSSERYFERLANISRSI